MSFYLSRALGRIALTVAASSLGFLTVPACAQAVREPLLDRLMGTALVSSPVLNARRDEVLAARSDIDVARWQYTPQFSADVQQGSGSSDLNSKVLRLDQRLYAGGRLDADLRTALSHRDGAVSAVRESAQALEVQIASSYQALATANSQTLAIEGYKKRLDALDGTISRRIETGVSAVADRALMSARIAQSTNDLATARAAQRNALASLDKLVGESRVVREIAPQVRVAPEPSITLAKLPKICGDDDEADAQLHAALAVDPGLQRMDSDIDAARAQVDSQRAALKPNIDLRLEQPISPSADSTLRSTRVSIVLSYAPDAGLSTLARAQGANDRVASLLNQEDAQRRDITQQIRAECADQAGTIERVATYREARGYTTEVLASSTRLFVAGKRSWLDLLNAAREDFDNEQAGIAARAALLGSAYRLAILTGERSLSLPRVEDEAPSNLGTTFKAAFR